MFEYLNFEIDKTSNLEETTNDFDQLIQYLLKDNNYFDNNCLESSLFPLPFYLPGDNPESQTSFLTETKTSNIFKGINKILDKTIIFNDQNLKNKENNDQEIIPRQYTFDIINPIIQDLNLPNNVKQKIVKDSNLNKIERQMNDIALIGKKKRRRKGKITFDDDKESQKVGRKKHDDFTKRKHDKNSADNIIKKIKLKFFEYSLKFLNNTLNSYLDKTKILEYNKMIRKDIKNDEPQNLIKLLDYKFVDKIKKETDLLLLKKPLKDIFANDISPKYSTLSRDSNKTMIERIIKDQKDNANIMFAFNLTFGEWIDVFTYKKELKSIKNYDEEKMKDLNDKFIKLDKLILEIYEKEYTSNYLSYFISYAFNYKRWFLMKKGRNRVSNKLCQK